MQNQFGKPQILLSPGAAAGNGAFAPAGKNFALMAGPKPSPDTLHKSRKTPQTENALLRGENKLLRKECERLRSDAEYYIMLIKFSSSAPIESMLTPTREAVLVPSLPAQSRAGLEKENLTLKRENEQLGKERESLRKDARYLRILSEFE
ncbi:Uncharacterised protein [Candidatus Anstonella stagnisolia]|nr:Uncharacterised protein [Candidatus Anstonella stagnisolia]